MIDDVIIGVPVDGVVMTQGPGWLPPTMSGERHVMPGSAGLHLTWSPSEQLTTIRLSVPKFINESRVNFPLHSGEGRRWERLGIYIGSALGLQAVDLLRCAVLRADFAVDLRVSDPIATIQALGCLRRKWGARLELIGRPVPSTIRWRSNAVSVQFYAKDVQLRAKADRADKEEQRERFLQVADRAVRVLRFEVSLRRPPALRSAFDVPSGHLPTLSFVLSQEASSRALSVQCDRLRLFDYADNDLDVPDSFRARIRSLGANVAGHIGQPVGRRKRLTDRRARDLAFVALLLSAYDRDELLAAPWSFAPSTLSEMMRDLAELGIVADGTTSGAASALLTELVDELRPHLTMPMEEWSDEDRYVWAPRNQYPLQAGLGAADA